MGNIPFCNYKKYCCNNNDNNNNNNYNNNLLKQNSNNNSNNNNNIYFNDENNIIEIRPKKEFIESYNATNNFFFQLNNITKIQRAYRRYKKKCHNKKFSSDIKDELTKSSTNNYNNKIKINDENNIINNEPNLSEKFLKNNHNNINKINIFINNIKSNNIDENSSSSISNHSYFSHSEKIFSNSNENNNNNISLRTLSNINNMLFGFFLKKKLNFKYIGPRDTINKKKNGLGLIKWTDNSYLIGTFKDNKISGYCKFYNNNENDNLNQDDNYFYYGNYINNVPKGYGYCIYNNNNTNNNSNNRFFDFNKNNNNDITIIEGEFKKNFIQGIGIENNNNKNIYKGSYNKGKYSGIGTYIWENGSIYQGEWIENTMSGYGIIKYNNNMINNDNNNNNNNVNNYFYEGEIQNGYMNGLGYFNFNGNKYIGYYNKDLKEGFGIFVWSEIPLKAYIGFWEKGKQNGLGVNINNNIVKYGIWKKGKKEIWLNNEKDIKKYISHNKYEKCFKNPIRYVNKILKIIDDY